MSKLLSANFMRLKKDKIFLISLIAVFLLSFGMILSSSNTASSLIEQGFERSLEDYFFTMVPFMGAIYAIFICLFLGTEYSDGTIRNKIIVGHTRTNIFLANYICVLLACLMIAAAWLLGSMPGILLIGMFEMSTGEVLAHFGVVIGFTMVYSALFTMTSMLNTNKAITVVFALVLWVALISCASALIDRLEEFEMLGGTAFINGEFVTMAEEPNPLYLRGWIRTVCEYIRDALPSGQAILMSHNEITNPLRQIISSVLVSGGLAVVGIQIYKKKDLK